MISQISIQRRIQEIRLIDDGRFPNSTLPVLLYKCSVYIPTLFPARHVKNIFEGHHWSNTWDAGIFEYHHYHSITHEVLEIYKGETTLLLCGDNGVKIRLGKGNVLVIPAGVAQKNLSDENDVGCIGAYPCGHVYDINYGRPGEKPITDKNISKVRMPETDPVYGDNERLVHIWHDQYRNIH